MKKNSIRLVTIFVLSLFLLFSFSACSGETAKQEEKDGKTTVTFWHVYSENFGYPVIKEMVDAFNAEHDDIYVDEVYNPDMYPGLMRNLQAEVASGNYPSIVMIGYNYLEYFASNFDYEDLTDWQYLQDNFLPNILTLAQTGGKQIGVPYCISAPILYYNADLFTEAGLDPDKPPQTWQEVREYAKQIKDKTGNYGFYMQEYADNWAVQGLLEGNGAKMLTDGKATFATPEAAEAYQLLADMVLVDESALHIAADEGIAAFSAGNVGMLLGTSAKIGTTASAASFDLRGVRFPSFGDQPIRVPAGGNFLPIMAKDKAEREAAKEFIKFIMQPEWLAKWSENTGYLPPRQEASDALQKKLTDGTVAQLWKVAFSELDGIYSWASYPGDIGTFAEQLLADTRDTILAGEKTPMEALQDAEDQLNEKLGK